jgi:hypothetical protein
MDSLDNRIAISEKIRVVLHKTLLLQGIIRQAESVGYSCVFFDTIALLG